MNKNASINIYFYIVGKYKYETLNATQKYKSLGFR